MRSASDISEGSPPKLIFRVSSWLSTIARSFVADACNSEAKVKLFDTKIC